MPDQVDSQPQCCRTCGYVGLRPKDGGDLLEIDKECRSTGDVQWKLYPKGPVCFHEAFDLFSEREEFAHRELKNIAKCINPVAVKHVFDKERTGCPWTRWIPGHTPKEHEDMSLLDKLESRTQQWRSEDIDWRLKVEEGIRKRHDKNLIVQLLLAILGGFVALVAAKLLSFFDL